MAKTTKPTQNPAAEEDSPPEYSFESNGAFTGVADDGRVLINIDSKWARTFSRLVEIPNEDEVVEPPPAYQSSPTPQWQCPLNIVVQVVGSRGDVQPFIAFGNELQSHGHRVRIATHDVFKDFVQSAGLEFYPIGGDPVELMAYMVKNPGLLPKMQTLKSGEISRKRKMVAEMLRGCWRSCIMPDPDTDKPFVANAIVANPVSFAHVHCAQAMAIPLHMMFTMPWSPTKAYVHPLANIQNHSTDPLRANYLSHLLMQAITWQGLASVINDFRKSLELEPLPVSEAPFILETLKISYTYCWSPSLAPKPKDWKDHIDVTGFIFRKPPTYTPPPDLSDFLKDGLPTIYIGFGSIVVEDPQALLQKILVAVKLAGVKAIVSAGWSNLTTDQVDSNVFFIGDCPHEWLFQQVDAVMHHGGAGTCAAGFLCGKPTIVIPFFGDQAFWGERIFAAGAGPRPIPYKEVTASKLVEAIQVCFTEEARAAAQRIATNMKQEDGARAAAESFYRSLSPEKLSCDICPSLPATFTLSLRFGREFKVSGAVAEILLSHQKVKRRRLNAYYPSPIEIENRRWDPLTGTASSTFGTVGEALSGLNDIWHGPYEVQQASKARELEKAAVEASGSADSLQTYYPDESTSKHALAMAGASAMFLPKMAGAVLKGATVDIPFALTEGLRNWPKLYGDEVPSHAPVTGLGSGLAVGGRELARGVGLGMFDFFIQPVKGYQKDGLRGAGIGALRGAFGTVIKSGAGLMGIWGYTAQGLWRSVYTATHDRVRRQVLLARIEHDVVFADRDRDRTQVSEEVVVERFEALIQQNKQSKKGKGRGDDSSRNR